MCDIVVGCHRVVLDYTYLKAGTHGAIVAKTTELNMETRRLIHGCARYNSEWPKQQSEHGAMKPHSQANMIAKVNHKPGYRTPEATRSRRQTMVALQKAAQAGYRNYVFRQVTVFPLPAARLLKWYIALPLMRSFLVIPGDVFVPVFF